MGIKGLGSLERFLRAVFVGRGLSPQLIGDALEAEYAAGTLLVPDGVPLAPSLTLKEAVERSPGVLAVVEDVLRAARNYGRLPRPQKT
jgi:hypothetical protein